MLGENSKMATLARMGWFVLVVGGLPVVAGPRTLAVASGDCRDAELLNAATSFSDAIGSRIGAEAVDPAGVLERFRPRPTSNLDDVKRQVDAAQTQFYSSQYDKALEGARSAQHELERMPPSVKPWKLTAQARVLEGLVLKAQNKKQEATDAFRRVLRIEPDFKLDPDYYTPATIAQLEQVRKETAKLKRVELSVTSTPPGAEVILDGQSVGKTPFKGNYLPGNYRVVLASGELTSFVYDVKLAKAEEVQVDFAFEGGLRNTLPLCVTAEAGQGYERALKLGARVNAEQVVVLRIESRSGEPGWATAVLLEVNKGTRLREGGMKAPNSRKSDGLAELAGFVLTGNGTARVVPFNGAPGVGAAAPIANTPVAEAEPEHGPAIDSVGPPMEMRASRRGVGPRVGSVVLMAAGVIAVGIGTALYVSGGANRDSLARLLDANGNVPPVGTPEHDGALRMIDQNNRTTLVSALAIGIGAAVLVTGFVLLLALPPQTDAQSPSISFFFSPERSSATAGVTGRF